jgi:ubiquinone/menaquinone biosynthesis C-methylase UbiE
MSENQRTTRPTQVLAFAVTALFLLGFFYKPVGIFTGTVLGVWFAGTQKLRTGFFWLMVFAFIPSLFIHLPHFLQAGFTPSLYSTAALFLAALLGVLPLTFHRLTSPTLPGFLSTLPFPLASVAIPALALSLHLAPASASPLRAFLICWFAATLLWMWNLEFKWATIFAPSTGYLLLFIALAAAGFSLFSWLAAAHLPHPLPIAFIFSSTCLAAALGLAVWALFHPGPRTIWANRPQAIARLRSPFTRAPLHLVAGRGREQLVSSSGERFPIRNGIPVFLQPQDLTGDNGKYNHLYATIAGFYDDIQRVFCALKGFDRNAYFRSYMSLVEVKPGDTVLETSVGTGLNYKYLPAGVQLSGLDLSAQMLSQCQVNLRRWHIQADLFQGNAETLPFADSSFDVVFHVGGINFFNDRAQAIREMIRVARPGSRLLIADETEKHVKEVYEKGLGSMYKDRKEPVKPPVDLVPAEMQEIQLHQMREGDWYVLTFRKPALA